MKSRRIKLLLVLALLVIALVIVLVPRWFDPITAASFEKIKEGMTLQDISQLLGQEHDPGTFIQDGTASTIWFGPMYSWSGDHNTFVIGFNDEGKAGYLRMYEFSYRRPGYWERWWKWIRGRY
ncbi:MAG: hypothetical protein L0215_26995 [Gemmataceae bacterium]|nr:hypothetical protein [Gemmataceae bacterium]